MKLAQFFGHDFMSAVRSSFRSRDLFFHDGAVMRQIHISAKAQVTAAATGMATVGLSLVAITQIAVGTPVMANALVSTVSADAAVIQMDSKVRAMQAELAVIRQQATEHARRLEARQAMLDAVISGKAIMPASVPASTPLSPQANSVIAPLAAVEGRQNMLASRLTAVTEARYHQAAAALDKVGLDPRRFHQIAGAMGGPYEPLPAAGTVVAGQADPQFRALFQSWKRLEQLQQGIVSIPSQRPVDSVTFTSGFGVRSDPFRGTAAMHAGVDMPGPVGTPIHATADGIVSRAQWVNGYGNLVELDHGKGIQTRYGHLSAILVQPGMRVTRGQLIARMGSTGRSTGSHLHYEVRLDGHAVNPMPFLQSASYLLAMQPIPKGKVAMGGPAGD